MRILFVTGRFPRPDRRGDQARAFHQLRVLSRRHEISLITAADAEVGASDRSAVAAWCREKIELHRSRLSVAAGLVSGLARGRPLQTAVYDTGGLRRAAHRLLTERRFDLVHVQLARLAAPFERGAHGAPRVLDFVDALSLNMERRRLRTRGPMSWLAALEQRRLLAYERCLCGSVEAATVVSEADRRAIGPFPNLSVNPNGVDLSRFPFHGAPRPARRLVFTGNLGYLPNVDAAVWFVREVFPRVRAAFPGTTLELVGARPAPSIQALASEEAGIRVSGFVPDMHPHLAGATVAVAPMRAGSGQLLKLLEAMATGTPVVATPLGASGLDVEDGRHLLLAESAQDFVTRISRLFAEAELGARLGIESRALVEDRYTWERSVAGLEAIYESVRART